MIAPITKKKVPIIKPDCRRTYGKESTPAPIAVDINANILPLIDPGVNVPNHLFQHDLLA